MKCLRPASWSGLLTLEPLVAVATVSLLGCVLGRVDSSTSYFQRSSAMVPPDGLRAGQVRGRRGCRHGDAEQPGEAQHALRADARRAGRCDEDGARLR